MKNRNRMNIFLLTNLWTVAIPLAFSLIILIASGFDELGVVLMAAWMIFFLPILLFGVTSFVMGYCGLTNWLISVPLLILWGGLTLLFSSFGLEYSPEPRLLFGLLKVLLLFGIAFGAGYLGRYLPKDGFVIDAVISGVLFLYISLGQIANGSFAPLDYHAFWTDDSSSPLCYSEQDNGTRYYKQIKILIDPFPARIAGIRYHNSKGEFVGYSNDQSVDQKVQGINEGDMTSDNSDILLHKNYESNLRQIIGPCENAIRKDFIEYSILMYYDRDTLFKKEISYYPNGVVDKVNNYYYDEAGCLFNDYEHNVRYVYNSDQHTFDPLGFFSGREEWRSGDFRKTNGVPQLAKEIGISLESIDNNTVLDESQKEIVRMVSIIDTIRKQLKVENRSDDNINILCKAAKFSPTSMISIQIDKGRGTWKSDFSSGKDFTQLKNVEQMNTVCDALALCRLESGMTQLYRSEWAIGIRIKEIKEDGGFLGLFLFDDMAVSSDSGLCFIYDPSIHKDPKKREDAERLWNEMKQIIESYE